MNELDGRKINRKALEEIRIRAVKRVEAGESPEVVIKAFGLTRPRIYEWIAKYREGGIEALKSSKACGRPPKLAGKDVITSYSIHYTKLYDIRSPGFCPTSWRIAW